MVHSQRYPDILPFARDLSNVSPAMESTRIGLLAGGGRFPLQFVHAAQAAGHHVFGLGIAGMASEELADACDEMVNPDALQRNRDHRH